METPTYPPRKSSRRLRIVLFLGLILLVQSVLAYLLTWVDPPRTPLFVPIRIASNGGRTPQTEAAALFADTMKIDLHRHGIEQALSSLARRGKNEPVIVYLGTAAVQGDGGSIYLMPVDASPDDALTWLPLRDVLEKLKACPSKHKLLVLELTPASARTGHVYHDLAAALPRELDAVPDADRLVLSACGPGQKPHDSAELGQSPFAHYFHEALRGHADGYGDLRDGHISVKELAAFVQARVERWSGRNRDERQTPMLLGSGSDFTLVSVDRSAPREPTPAIAARAYPHPLLRAWHDRDAVYQSSQYRWTPHATQWQQAMLHTMERDAAADLKTCAKIQEMQQCSAKAIASDQSSLETTPEAAQKIFAENWRILEQQLATAQPTDVERIKKRFIEEVNAKLLQTERDTIVFAHVRADSRLDPATLRLCDQLLHPTPQSVPRTAETLRLRLLADLALRVEIHAWPLALVEMLLHCTDEAEKALKQTPYLPDYVALLEEPARTRHDGEARLWTRGYSSLDDAKDRLRTAGQQFTRLNQLNEKWRQCELVLDETFAELPWYLEALEALPELREPWQQTAKAARNLAEGLKASPQDELSWLTRVDRRAQQIDAAEKHSRTLQQHRQSLHAPFAKEALVRLERQCRAPNADTTARHVAEATLSVAAPILKADDRVALWNALQILARRLNDETLALDRQDDEAQRHTPTVETKTPPLENESRRAALRAQWQLALFELAGVADENLHSLRQGIGRCQKDAHNAAGWCELGAIIHRITHKQMPEQWKQETSWRERERLAWLMPPLGSLDDVQGVGDSPTIEHRRREKERHARWLHEHQRYLARAFQGLNLESPGIVAARSFYAQALAKAEPEAHVRMSVAVTVEPLTEKHSYAHLWLEVTRQVPAGAFGPVELQFHRTDDVWLAVAPASASLPALVESKAARTLTHKVPLKAIRKPKAERTGLPTPIGFMVEARFEGRSYHHLVTVPIIPSTQELQILVSADPDEPGATLSEIHVRPGNVKQPHYIYLRNLTNRTQKVHVEVKAGAALLYKSQKPLTIDPDGVRKVLFDESARAAELRGPLEVRVLDQDRQKLIAQRSLRVDILAARDYVKVAQASYEPGLEGNNKWAIQVETTKHVPGPAIAAQLVLPVQRIPGLLGIGGGTLRIELPTQSKTPRILFAERLRLVPSTAEEGPVYLHIDGVPRAFVYRTTFSRNGQTTEPVPDDRPAVRIVAPPCVMAGINCLVDVEVDNAPPGCKLEVALGRAFKDGAFKAEIVREFTDAKKRRIDLEASKDALVFDAAIGDWTATFDTRSIVGARELRARLIDQAGQELASSKQSVIIDDSPPIAKMVLLPAQVKRGSILQVQAEGADPETGIAQVVFFFGRPDKGEIPPSAPRFKAIPARRDQTLWGGALLVPPDHKGPLALSVHVVNNAGLATVDTVTLDVTDTEPGKTGLGEIRGIVFEGQRVQPNLLVTLTDEAGKEIARTRTLANGTYSFPKLAPRRYRVICVKPESQRRAVLDVIVEPDRTTKGDLALAL